MAINYLNSIDLNQNELLHGTIENQASDALAGTPVEGQLYFNTASQVLKVGRDDGTGTMEWVEVGGGVETLTTTQSGNSTGNALTVLSSATGDVTINSFAYAGGNNIGYVPTGGTASNFLKGDGTWAALDNYGNWKLSANGGATINVNSGGTVDFVGTGTTTVSRSSKTITINSADQYVGTVTSVAATHAGNAFTASIGNTSTVNPSVDITMNGSAAQYVTGQGNLATFPSIPSSFNVTLTGDVTGSGATGTNIATTISAGAVDFAMINAAAVITETEGIENNDNDTTLPTSAAVKAYADSLIVGGLIYQGGYNAATNTPDLDSSPSASIKKGWTYTVTADGSFFTEQVRVGDVLIAEQDAPTTLANWTTVQNNIDLADASTVGIGNVNINGAGNKDGLSLSYSAGTATLGLDITSLPNFANLSASDMESIEIPVYDGDTGDANKKVELRDLIDVVNTENTYAVTITDTATITHGLGTKDVIIQLYDTVTNETVYADVLRVNTSPYNTATITFASTPTNSVRVLVQKIG